MMQKQVTMSVQHQGQGPVGGWKTECLVQNLCSLC
jgi:hypothetical protein